MHDRASKAAQARWDKQQNDATSNAQAMLKQCPSPSPSPSSTSLTTTIKTITPEGVSDSIFKDYMEVRKAKKAKWTQTALKGLVRESEKANISLQEAMQICCERGWIGFKADWIKDKQLVNPQNKMSNFWAQIEGVK
jgi:hypothetical protein